MALFPSAFADQETIIVVPVGIHGPHGIHPTKNYTKVTILFSTLVCSDG